MSDEDDDLLPDLDTSQSNEDEWIIPEPCVRTKCLHWSEEGIFAIAARHTVYLVDPCLSGTEGLIGTVALSSRVEKSPISEFRIYDYANDSRFVEDLHFQMSPATVSATGWSPAGLGTNVRSLCFDSAD